MSSFTKNPFELLGDDAGDAGEVTAQKKVQQAPAAAPQKKEDRRENTRGEERGGRGGARGGRSSFPRDRNLGPRFRREREDDKEFSRSARGARSSERARGGNRRGGRGRQFDRHSATGIVDNEKKEKQGWGDSKTSELDGEKIASNDVNEAANEDKKEAAPVEPEEVVKTLDEYLAEKAAKSLAVSAPAPRKANEGVDNSQWGDAVPLEKEDSEYLRLGKEKAAKGKKEKSAKTFVDIEQRFAEVPRRGGFRDERRNGRGGEKPKRGGRKQANGAVNVSDETAFPSLK
ncbi:uncharacterized protein VTP21DRAFT_5700 [Calcarisporiella thermophila]|uniref:uncharacterized protein n=1 Tax=Calcarisporiella thermophila TaxID=911321 RepID=UPI00374431ED